MRRRTGGYTLIEVMLFLAISSILLVAAVLAVGGQTGETEFRTSVDNVNTKLQQWVDQVQNGESGSTSTSDSSASLSNLVCIASGNTPSYPLLSAESSNQRGANPDCIYLGNAILFNNNPDNNNHIYSIPIIGLRLSASGSGNLSSSIEDAGPIAALNDGPGGPSQVDLSDEYTIPNGTRVLWARDDNPKNPNISSIVNGCTSFTNTGSCSFMAGFFTSPTTSAASESVNGGNGSLSLLSVLYPYNTSVSSITDSSIAQCLMLQGEECTPSASTGPNLWPLSRWEICLASTRNDDWAAIQVDSSSGFGFSTSVDYSSGGTPCPN